MTAYSRFTSLFDELYGDVVRAMQKSVVDSMGDFDNAHLEKCFQNAIKGNQKETVINNVLRSHGVSSVNNSIVGIKAGRRELAELMVVEFDLIPLLNLLRALWKPDPEGLIMVLGGVDFSLVDTAVRNLYTWRNNGAGKGAHPKETHFQNAWKERASICDSFFQIGGALQISKLSDRWKFAIDDFGSLGEVGLFHNLPEPSYGNDANFVGRVTDLNFAKGLLEQGGYPIVNVKGAGGIGKTALVRKLCEDLSLSSSFTHIVWVSAKEFELGIAGQIRTEYSPDSILSDLKFAVSGVAHGYTHHELIEYRDIADVSEIEDEALSVLRNSRNRILIVLDNYESILYQEREVLEGESALTVYVRNELRTASGVAQILVTSREDFNGAYNYYLGALKEPEAVSFLKRGVEGLNVSDGYLQSIDRKLFKEWVAKLDYYPLWIKHLLGWLNKEMNVEEIFRRLKSESIGGFVFDSSLTACSRQGLCVVYAVYLCQEHQVSLRVENLKVFLDRPDDEIRRDCDVAKATNLVREFAGGQLTLFPRLYEYLNRSEKLRDLLDAVDRESITQNVLSRASEVQLEGKVLAMTESDREALRYAWQVFNMTRKELVIELPRVSSRYEKNKSAFLAFTLLFSRIETREGGLVKVSDQKLLWAYMVSDCVCSQFHGWERLRAVSNKSGMTADEFMFLLKRKDMLVRRNNTGQPHLGYLKVLSYALKAGHWRKLADSGVGMGEFDIEGLLDGVDRQWSLSRDGWVVKDVAAIKNNMMEFVRGPGLALYEDKLDRRVGDLVLDRLEPFLALS